MNCRIMYPLRSFRSSNGLLLVNSFKLSTQTRLNRTSILIWIQTFDTNDIFLKELFEEKNQSTKKHAKLPSMQRVKSMEHS